MNYKSCITHCEFSVSDNFILLWNARNTTTKLTSGERYTVTVISSTDDVDNVQLLISTCDNKKNYVVAKSNGVWGPIYQIATTDVIPTKVSQLDNDMGYNTTSYTPSIQHMTEFC